ncbi:hypothetical protein B0H16DRAFT_1024090 [Mycena metata]|uniref:Uncharacterized protein n=1 Tax=Mycena metata TaxID=1033252 RepID=A0AAD7IHE0_9AGAR|nr:hypothetical protein B0H16DRAFT_1024090 [Mycena metata]
MVFEKIVRTKDEEMRKGREGVWAGMHTRVEPARYGSRRERKATHRDPLFPTFPAEWGDAPWACRGRAPWDQRLHGVGSRGAGRCRRRFRLHRIVSHWILGERLASRIKMHVREMEMRQRVICTRFRLSEFLLPDIAPTSRHCWLLQLDS